MKQILLVLASAFCIAQIANSQEVVVYTSVDQIFSQPIFEAYEETTGIRVLGVYDTEETKSTGLVNRLIAEKNRPRADVFFSGDPMRSVILKNKGVLAPYQSPNAKGLPKKFQDKSHMFTGFSSRARVILVNTDLVSEPNSIRGVSDFLDSQWRDQTAVANPLFGTTSYHVAALFAVWGEEKAKQFLNAIKDNGCRIVSSNGEVRRLVSQGEIAFGLTDTDDANVAVSEGASVKIVFPDQETKGEWGGLGTLLVPSAASLIHGAPHEEEAKKFIDYLLSPKVERMLANMECAHIPLREGVKPPEGMPAIETLKNMNVDIEKTANLIQDILPWLRQWAQE